MGIVDHALHRREVQETRTDINGCMAEIRHCFSTDSTSDAIRIINMLTQDMIASRSTTYYTAFVIHMLNSSLHLSAFPGIQISRLITTCQPDKLSRADSPVDIICVGFGHCINNDSFDRSCTG